MVMDKYFVKKSGLNVKIQVKTADQAVALAQMLNSNAPTNHKYYAVVHHSGRDSGFAYNELIS